MISSGMTKERRRVMRPEARLSVSILAGAAMFLALLACQPQDNSGERTRQDESGGPRAVLASTRLNSGFERNVGQTDKSVQYLLRGRRHVLFLTGREAVMTLRMPTAVDGSEHDRPTEDGEPVLAAVLRMMFEGAAAPLKIEAEQPLPTRINDYRSGGGRTPKTDIPTYGRVRYRNVWTGIDAEFSTDDGRPRYVFIVAPGADPANIRLSFSGAKEIDVAEDGDLVILTEAGEVRHSAPKVNQRGDGARQSTAGRYVIAGTTVSFRFGAYDPTLPLVIHPTVEFSGFVGGAAAEESRVRLVIGPDGMVYMAGTTAEPIGLPEASDTEAGLGQDGWGEDGYVAKFDPANPLAPLLVTYVGGSGDDTAADLAVNAAGQVYVVGRTGSGDLLPATDLSPLIPYRGGGDAYVVALTDSLTPFAFSYLGGTLDDQANGVAVDSSGAYVTGFSKSSAFVSPHFTEVPALYGYAAWGDGFVLKLDSALSAIQYFTYLGGSDGDEATDVAVHGGSAYVTGHTKSNDFLQAAGEPSLPGGNAGGFDMFVAKISPGGDAEDRSRAIEVDGSGTIHVVGEAFKGGTTDFPTTDNALQTMPNGFFFDAVYLRLPGDGSALLYSTFLGGDSFDLATDIAIGSGGNAFITGYGYVWKRQNGESYDFLGGHAPVSCGFGGVGGDDGLLGRGKHDAFVVKIRPDTTDPGDPSKPALDWWCLIGGGSSDRGWGIATAEAGAGAPDSIYIAGWTESLNFLSYPEPGELGGTSDNFLVKLTEVEPPPPVLTDIAVAKAADRAKAEVDEPMTYLLEVSNNGPETAAGVTVTDTLPPGFAYTGFVSVPSAGTGAAVCPEPDAVAPPADPHDGTVVSCTIAELEVGAAPTEIRLTVVPEAEGDFTNRATVEAGDGQTDNVDHNDFAEVDTEVTVTPIANLTLEKSAASASVRVNQTIDYTITITNAGPGPATGVFVEDILPSGFEFVGSDPPLCVEDPPTFLKCTFADPLPAPDEGTGAPSTTPVVITARPTQAGDYVNWVQVVAENLAAPVPWASVTTRVDENPALTLTTTGPAEVTAAAPLSVTYTLTVTNGGEADAGGVRVEDRFEHTLPGNVTYSSFSSDPAGGPSAALCNPPPSPGEPPATNIECEIETLPAGDATTVNITVEADTAALGTITNEAALLPNPSSTRPYDVSNPAAPVTTHVVADPDLILTKSAAPDPVLVGGELVYTLEITNAGLGEAKNVRIDDQLDPVLADYVVGIATEPADAADCNQNGALIECKVGKLSGTAAGTAAEPIKVFIEIKPPPASAGEITNKALLFADHLDAAAPPTETVTTIVDPIPLANLRLEKRQENVATVGNELVYVIAVANAGPSGATEVVVTDTLPVTFKYVGYESDPADGPGAAICPAPDEVDLPADPADGLVVTCKIENLAPAATPTEIRLTVVPSETGADFTNQVTAVAEETDPQPNDATNPTKVTTQVFKPAVCNDLAGVPPMAVYPHGFVNGEVAYRPLVMPIPYIPDDQPGDIGVTDPEIFVPVDEVHTRDWFPFGVFPPGDGKAEILVSQGLEIELPYAAQWVRLHYANSVGATLDVRVFDDTGQEMAPVPSNTSSFPLGSMQTHVMQGLPIRKLQVEASAQILILGICYAENAQVGETAVWRK